AKRDTDTMDTFVDSSWYYMRYASAGASTMVDERAQYWMPMDQYIGGIEHAILHLLYARFWTKAMRDLGLVKIDEPFTNLLTQGMVLNHIFSRRSDKGAVEYFAPDEVELRLDAEGKVASAAARSDGQPVSYDGLGSTAELKALRLKVHATIEKVGDDYGRRLQFNTAIAAIRETLNLYSDLKDSSAAARRVRHEVLETCVLLLAPIVPHICTELWSQL